MNFKTAINCLLVASVVWLLFDLYRLYMDYTMAWSFYKNRPGENMLNVASLIIPVAVLMFSLSLLNGNADEVFDEEEQAASIPE